MAGKKGQPIQLQIEVNTDDEWEKLLQKEGLIVVDIYSDWCGPCLGMQANLKKLKLEIGGDMLQLAIAKSDGITQLKRFRNKSEPTWMFLSKGKMVNLMLGADAPKLTRMIIEELKKEQAIQSGQATDRAPMEVTDLAEEEKVRYDAKEAVQRQILEKEEQKKAKELLERRTKECENIVENLPNFGTAIIFPSAKDRYKEVLNEILDEAGLVVQQTDKVRITEDQIAELCFFTDKDAEFTEDELQELYESESLIILLKINPRAEIEDIDDAILSMVYGEHKKPPGGSDSAAKRMLNLVNRKDGSIRSGKSVLEDVGKKTTDDDKSEPELPQVYTTAIWVPHTPFLRATALRVFFHKYCTDFTIPPPEPPPDHIAVIFNYTKKNEVMQVVQDYPKEIMAYGFFTSADADEAKLVAKTVRKFENVTQTTRTLDEKLVLKVSKKKSECVFAFAQLGPLYMSPNAAEGKIECEKFFPEDYVEEEEEEPEPEPVKESKKKAIATEEGEVAEGEEADISGEEIDLVGVDGVDQITEEQPLEEGEMEGEQEEGNAERDTILEEKEPVGEQKFETHDEGTDIQRISATQISPDSPEVPNEPPAESPTAEG